MQTGAISPMNFRGYDYPTTREYMDFEDSEILDLETEIDKFDKVAELSTKLVDSKDVKSPLAAVAAISYAAIKSFVKGAASICGIDKVAGKRISGAFEGGLKKGSDAIKTLTNKMTGKESAKVLNLLGKGLENGREFAVNIYKKLSKNNSTRGLAFCVGIVTAAALLPGILKKDGNDDGIADILQKSQNVYESNCKKLDNIAEKTGIIAEMTQLLT